MAQSIRLVLVAAFFGVVAWPQTAPAAQLQALIQQGEQELAAQRYGEAAAAFEKARQLSPGVAEIHARLGVIYFQDGKFDAAVPALRQAIKLKPALPNLDVLLAMCLAETGRLEESLPGLEKGFRRTPDPALKRMSGLQLQRAMTGLRRDSKAVEVALELVRLYPDDPEILYHSGRLFGNFAYLNLKHLSEVAPNSLWRQLAAGEAFESQGSLDQALAKYREVLALDPKRPAIHYRMGRVFMARPQGEAQADALREFEAELEVDPTNANAAYEAGEIHRKAGRFDVANRLFEQAIRYDSSFEDAHIGLGRTLLALDKPARALPHIQKAIALNSESEVAFYALAQAQRVLGNSAEQQKALAEFRRLRDSRPAQQLKDPRREITRQEVDAREVQTPQQ